MLLVLTTNLVFGGNSYPNKWWVFVNALSSDGQPKYFPDQENKLRKNLLVASPLSALIETVLEASCPPREVVGHRQKEYPHFMLRKIMWFPESAYHISNMNP